MTRTAASGGAQQAGNKRAALREDVPPVCNPW